MVKQALSLLAAVTLVLSLALFGPAASFAAPLAVSGVGDPYCPHASNFGANGCLHDVVQNSNYAEWHNNQMTMTLSLEQAGNHLNHTLWSYSVPGGSCTLSATYLMETGLTQGFHGHVAYEWYYARSSIYGYADYESVQTTADGSNHSYEVDNAGGGVYYAYRDGGLLLGASGLGASGICIAQVGSELTSVPNGNYYSATFDQTPLRWTDTSGIVHTGWNSSQSWIDYPCGQGQDPPNCFNGVYYNDNQRSDNKP